jgi:hypothetical protein
MLICNIPYDVFATTENSTDDISNYKFSYMSTEEALAFLGFLLNSNDIEGKYDNTDIYLYLIGDLKNDPQKESMAKMAFAYVADTLLQARLDDSYDNMVTATSDICSYLEKKYGTNSDYEVANECINSELSTFKKIVLEFVAIATDTESYEIEAVAKGLGYVKDVYTMITNPQKKVKSFTEDVEAILNVAKFTSSVQRYDMYQTFEMYISNANVYLSFGENDISDTIIYFSQEAHNLYNERSKWADCIEKIVKAVDIFKLLNNYWLDWSTDSRIALLKKWAGFIAYTKKSAVEMVDTSRSEYELKTNSFITDSGNTINYCSRSYSLKYDLTSTITKDDIKYTVNGNNLTIDKYIAYDGKYSNIAIPKTINGYTVTKIGDNAFEGYSFDRIIIPSTVSVIGDRAFYGMTSLDDIVILGENVSIANNAFDFVITTNEMTIDQSSLDTYIYCEADSNVRDFISTKKGFYYKSLAWDGNTIWGVASLNKVLNIYTANELAYVSEIVSCGDTLNEFTINLCSDIDLGNNEFTPIGSSEENYFSGSFDGFGYKISNYYANKKGDFVGVFGKVCVKSKSCFKNVTIQGVNENSDNSSRGGLIGSVYMSKDSSLTISDIISDVKDTVCYGKYSGGIVGLIESQGNCNISINKCAFESEIKEGRGFNSSIISGIVAYCSLNEDDNIEIKECLLNGHIQFNRGYQSVSGIAGGLIGKAVKGNYKFLCCCVNGKVVSNSFQSPVGGLVTTFAPNSFLIEDCEVFANIISSGSMVTVVGGFIGNLETENFSDNSNLTINNSFVSAVLKSGFGSIGAFINSYDTKLSDYSIELNNCYFDCGKASVNSSDLVISNHQQMLGGQRASKNDKWYNSGVYNSEYLKTGHDLYSEWNFEDYWNFSKSGYPMLKAFNVEPCSNHDCDGVVTKTTCTEKGYTTYTCKLCGYEYKGDYIDATGHVEGEPVIIESTYDKAGSITISCTVCGAIISKESLPLKERVVELEDGTTWYYDIKDNKAIINRYEGSVEDVSIPSELDGYTVVALEDYLFNRNTVIKTVVVPNSITSISEYAFRGCQSLTSVSLGNSITSIGQYAFCGCYSLTSISLGNNLKSIGDSAFSNCIRLEDLAIPNSVTSIGNAAFMSTKITNAIIPNGITSIGDSTFEGCSNLASVTIPDSVTSIEDWAFCRCSSLTSITIPDNVTFIGDHAFSSCENLKSVVLPNKITSISDGLFTYCSALENVTIPDSVTSIGEDAFNGCLKLKDVYYSTTAEKWNSITIGTNNEPLTSATIHFNDQIGDVNMDGQIDVRDTTAIQKHIVALELFNDEQLFLADTDGDGLVTIMDATLIQKYIAGITPSLG